MWTRVVTVTLLVGLSLILGRNLTADSTADSKIGPRRWITDYSFARREADRLGLPLLIHFHASWCGPCGQMESETLSRPDVQAMLGTKFIGVKIDNDQQFDLVQAFRVTGLPSDIIVSPDGRIVARTSGYQSQKSYLESMSQWGSAFTKERTDALARLEPKPAPKPEPSKIEQKLPMGILMPELNPMLNLFTNKPKVAPRPEPTPPVQQPTPEPEPIVAADETLVGLEGYSPVSVKRSKSWVKGRSEYKMTYQEVVYYLSDANELTQFRASPDLYAPRLLGCDPVEYFVHKRVVQGSVQYAALFDGNLYLFESIDSRNRFKIDPDRYTSPRVALRADDIVRTRLR